MLDKGPANETNAPSLFGLKRLCSLTGTGFPQPKPKKAGLLFPKDQDALRGLGLIFRLTWQLDRQAYLPSKRAPTHEPQ